LKVGKHLSDYAAHPIVNDYSVNKENLEDKILENP